MLFGLERWVGIIRLIWMIMKIFNFWLRNILWYIGYVEMKGEISIVYNFYYEYNQKFKYFSLLYGIKYW